MKPELFTMNASKFESDVLCKQMNSDNFSVSLSKSVGSVVIKNCNFTRRIIVKRVLLNYALKMIDRGPTNSKVQDSTNEIENFIFLLKIHFWLPDTIVGIDK